MHKEQLKEHASVPPPTSSPTRVPRKLDTTCAAHPGSGGLPSAEPAFPRARRNARLPWDAEPPSPAQPAGDPPASRIAKRHGKTEAPTVPACPLLSMPPCSGPLRGKRHVSLGGDPRPLLGRWEGSSWPRAKPSAPGRTGRVGEDPSLLCGHQPRRPSLTLVPSASSPTALDITATLRLRDPAPRLGKNIPPRRRSPCTSPSAASPEADPPAGQPLGHAAVDVSSGCGEELPW